MAKGTLVITDTPAGVEVSFDFDPPAERGELPTMAQALLLECVGLVQQRYKGWCDSVRVKGEDAAGEPLDEELFLGRAN